MPVLLFTTLRLYTFHRICINNKKFVSAHYSYRHISDVMSRHWALTLAVK